LRKTSNIESTGQKSRIADLEKRSAEADAQVDALRVKLQQLDKEKTTLALALQTREQDLLKKLDEQERAWAEAKDAFEERINAVSREAAQKDQTRKQEFEAARQSLADQLAHTQDEAARKAAAQQALITTLEKRSTEAEAQVAALREKLQGVMAE